MRNIVRTHLGKTVDITALANKNATVRSAGNANVNARGDKLGPGGKIIKTKEELITEYNDKNPKAVERSESLNKPVNEMLSGNSNKQPTPNATGIASHSHSPATQKTTPATQTVTNASTSPKNDIESLKKLDVGVSVDESNDKK